MANYAANVDPQIKKEMEEVNRQVEEASKEKKVIFSHGMCIPHMIQTYLDMGYDTAEIEKTAEDAKKRGNIVPCLLQNAPLRHAYMRGLFTVEQMKQAQQQMQQDQQKSSLSERFRKLAGIRA